MSKKITIPLKILVFIAGFYLFSVALAFFLRDDGSSYGRIVLHELYEQKKIDWLYCGASHVSHGIDPLLADELTGASNFCSGTANQNIDGTYAVLQQALKLYKVQKVFLELDFAITTRATLFKERTGFKSDYLVSHYLKDSKIKCEYLMNMSSPKYYLNTILPIGKDKYMTLNPKLIGKKIKSMINGDYFNYVYTDKGSEYVSKGCILDFDQIDDGSFINDHQEGAVAVKKINIDWKNTIDKIIELCRSNGTELIFYSMPGSDFYLNEKGNYDEYYDFCVEFLKERGFKYYDFNLAKEKYLNLKDSDYSDDNHLNKNGVRKWTRVFCDFMQNHFEDEDYFYASYQQKMDNQPDKIFGVLAEPSEDKKSILITPITNHVDKSRITVDCTAYYDSKEQRLFTDSEMNVVLPEHTNGTLKIITYIDGVPQTCAQTDYNAF